MTYNNPFGGQWVWDAANPFNVSVDEPIYKRALLISRRMTRNAIRGLLL